MKNKVILFCPNCRDYFKPTFWAKLWAFRESEDIYYIKCKNCKKKFWMTRKRGG